MIDMASVYAERYKKQPQMLQAAVMGQSPDPKLDPYTALNALKLVKESQRMAMAGQAQQPTSSPSIVAENMAPNPMMQGLGAMIPGAMGQVPQGQAPAPQAPVRQAPPMQAASGGLAGMYTPEEDYAEGGIVAFGRGGSAAESEYQGETVDEGYSDSQGRDIDEEGNLIDVDGTGNAGAQGDFNAYLMKRLKAMEGFNPKEMSEGDQDRLFKKFYEREEKMAGPDIYAAEIARGKDDESDRAKRRNTGEGMALLTAAGKILKGRSLAEGASEALPAYASAMSEVDRADQAARSANAKMQFALKDAQRKERMGNVRAATASMENARKFQQDANKALFDKERALADLAAKGAVANRPLRGAGAGGPKLAEQLAAAELEYAKNPTKENRAAVEALTRAAAKTRTSFSTSEVAPVKAATALAPVQERIDAQVSAAMKNFPVMNRAYSAAERRGDKTEMKRLWDAEEKRQREIFTKSEAAAGGGGGAKPRNTGTMPPPPAGFLPDNG